MTKDNSNTRTPIIRFQGFNGEWKKKKIGDIAIVLQGYGFPEKYQGQKYGDLPFCKVGDISSAVDRGEMVINKADNFVDYSLLPVLHARPIPVGSTIFAKIGEAIRSNKRIRTGVPCLIDNNAAAVKSKGEISDTFLFYLMSKVNLADYSGGIVPSVNKSTIEAIDVLVPSSRNEQQKIAECLEAIDQMISAQNRKVESLKAHKKGLIQQLFPQPGATTPALRFPGFTGDWEVKKLGEIADVNPKSDKLPNKFVYIDLESVESGNLLKKNIIEVKNAPSRAQRLLKKGDILFQMVRPYQRNNYHFYDNDVNVYVASTGYAQIRYKDCSEYLYQYLHTDTFVDMAVSKCVGGNYPAINTTDLTNITVYLPSPAEQQMIAECLGTLDNLIAAESKKLGFLKSHKKGLMQQLFPQPEK